MINLNFSSFTPYRYTHIQYEFKTATGIVFIYKIEILSGNFYVFMVRNIRMETYGAHWIVRDGKKIMMVISEYLYDSKNIDLC